MLQMPVASHGIQSDADEDDSECRCPGYYADECNANWWQGCNWADSCQCDENWVYTSKVFTGRYIRPTGASAGSPIYWEKMGKKYTISSCDMCDGDTSLAAEDRPCASWVEPGDDYIQRLTVDDNGPLDFQCAQHPNHQAYAATSPTVIEDQACHAMDHLMIQGCVNTPRSIQSGCNVADVRCCADVNTAGFDINTQTRTKNSSPNVACNSGGFPATFTFSSGLDATGLACNAGHCNDIDDSWCYESVTFEQAQEICASQSQRLCTRSEIEDDEACCGNGCGHNGHLIWFDNEGTETATHAQCSSNPTTISEITASDIRADDYANPVTTQLHGAVPFASSSSSCDNVAEGEGAAFSTGTNCFQNINDGEFGDADSDKAWIPGGTYNNRRFVGVRFDGVQSINTFTLARDRSGHHTDHIGAGNFRFEYTMEEGATYTTANGRWCSAGTFTRTDAALKVFRLTPHIQATAIRIVVPEDAAIDELEAWYQFDGNQDTVGGYD